MADVPAPVKWLAYVTTESMGQRGTIQPVECTTSGAAEIVELGDLKVIPGHRLRGVVRIADGRSVPPDLTMRIFSAVPRNSVAVPVRGNGEFEFIGLPGAHYDLSPEARDYRVTEPVSNLLVDRDISDLKITLEAVKR